jgi:tetratricopeptide (TPR) repeat protein
MQGIKAFVGHSFAPVDKTVVDTFLEYFRTLSKVYPGFMWDHAEEAESKTLSEKVLSKIQDKNVFIGICTGRELVVEQSSLTGSFLTGSTLKAKRQDFEWKTSDWIIQEIGLAIGRNMKLIIFLEEGVREPGGLYGSLEYISFTRSHPNDCFDKMLQMLNSLSPIEASVPQAQAKPTVSEKGLQDESSEGNSEPKPTWKQDDYDNAAFHAILKNDQAGLDKINTAYAASIFAQDQTLAVWHAHEEYMRVILGKNPNFDKLKKISSENSSNSKILYYLARGYADYDDHGQAAKTFERAADNSSSEEEVLQNLGDAAAEHAYAGEKKRAIELLEKIKTTADSNPEFRNIVLSSMQSFAIAEKEDDLLVAIMEHRVELQPGDSDARFNLAYKHSEIENEDMALQHYTKIPMMSRNGITWNNLGVSFGEFGMPVRSVRAFRNSEAANETLAMSNLGFKFLSAGFVDEAQQQCDKALAIPDYHKNIPQLLTRLKDVSDEEQKKLDDTIEKVKPKAAFYRKVGEATVSAMPRTVAVKWRASECILEAAVDGTAVRMVGTYESPGSVLAGLVAGGFIQPSPVKSKIEYIAELRGQALIGSVSRTRSDPPPSLLEIAGNKAKVLMYFSPDGQDLHVMENVRSATPRFYTLKNVP